MSYTGGPYVLPNQSARVNGEADPLCEEELNACDVFTLSLQVSDAARQASASNIPFVEISVGWELGEADFDVYVYGPDGGLITYAYTTSNPEVLLLTLDEMPNGDYRIVVIPWQPLAQEITGTITLSGLATSKSGALAFVGAMGAPALLMFGLMAGLRGIRSRR